MATVPTFTGRVTHLDAATAAAVDDELMAPDGPVGFTLAQLMELAGLAVAQAVHDFIRRRALPVRRVVVVCGPGNNGGDGIVAARHLALFLGGASIEMVVPKPNTKNEYFAKLTRQAVASGVTDLGAALPDVAALRAADTVIVDAIFGFSFKGTPRAPFDAVLRSVNAATAPGGEGEAASLCCVDIPSGWDVDRGRHDGDAAALLHHPSMLISLTLPKNGAREFSARGCGLAHYLGGRFVPRDMAARFEMPTYPGAHGVVLLEPAA